MNNTSSNSLKKNTYRLSWDIEDWDYFIAAYRNGKEFVIRSPVLTAKCLDHTSWFITIRLSKFNEDLFAFYLNRSEEDEGAEVVEIDWEIEFTEEGFQMDFQKEDYIINFFKKGGSNKWGVLPVTKRHFATRTLNVTCKMEKLFPAEESILEIVDARSKNIVGNSEDLDTESLYGPIETEYELSFYASNAVPLAIRIQRTDKDCFLSCYFICFIKILKWVNFKKKLIWSGKIDHMHKAINIEEIIDKTIFDNEFPISVSENLSAEYEYVCTVIKKKVEVSNVSTGNKSVKDLMNNNDSTPKINSLVCDLVKMYKNGVHSDVTLQAGRDTFKTHKCLLSARSPVFSAMFSQDMTEKKTGVVNITDIETPTLCLLLNFMYTDTVGQLDANSALKLLLAAEKYQIPSLKEICSAYLTRSLSENNVCDILNIADMVQHKSLKVSAVDYVKKYAHKILNSENWKQLLTSNTCVVSETLSEISLDLWTATTKRFPS